MIRKLFSWLRRLRAPSVVTSEPLIVNMRKLHDELHPPARTVVINLHGDMFTAQSVGGLFDRLNDELGVEGLKLSTVYTGGGGPGGALDKDDASE